MLACALGETVKWGGPVYTANGRNVVGLAAFKSCFGLWFFDGARLADKDRVLVNAQEGKSKSMRQRQASDVKPAAGNSVTPDRLRRPG